MLDKSKGLSLICVQAKLTARQSCFSLKYGPTVTQSLAVNTITTGTAQAGAFESSLALSSTLIHNFARRHTPLFLPYHTSTLKGPTRPQVCTHWRSQGPAPSGISGERFRAAAAVPRAIEGPAAWFRICSINCVLLPLTGLPAYGKNP